MNASKPPVLAIVSTDIRRDLVAPVRHFTRLRIRHFYRQAPYGDLTAADLHKDLVRYHSPLELFRLLWRTRPDIVEGVEPYALSQFPYHAVMCLYAFLRRVPLAADAHISRPLPEKYGRAVAALLRLVLQPSLRRTSLFFYVNEGARRNLRWLGVPERKLIRHMYGTWGVDPDEFTPVRDGREPDWGSHPVLLSVGRLHAEKGILDLLEAYGLVRRQVPNARLVFIGDGPHRVQLERLVEERGWQGSVLLLGTVKNRDLPPYLRAATLVVSPSRTTRKWEEYVGATNLQAMACGVPVVSTRSGAIPEYVPETAGVLVPERDPGALAAAIVRLVADPAARVRMGEAGRAHAVAWYDARRNVQEAERLLLALL
ncbi:MAG: glycosyltransferase family 4 protein [Anaerolineae bacterium]|nr:glycosyltransferase family 4 protein [Anaerolineae bacterium]